MLAEQIERFLTDRSDEWAVELAFISVHFIKFYMDGRPFNVGLM